jgi:hypothetical protein
MQEFRADTRVQNYSCLRHIGRGSFVPTTMSDADSLVCRCEGCQFFFSPETCAVSSTANHTNNMAFLHMGP